MNREEFREAVFARDNNQCVVCGAPAVDAHHLMDRRLFKEGDPIWCGYDIDNGVSLCANHHLDAESTTLSPKLLREYAHITRVVLPDHLDADEDYTKWGDVCTKNGRMPGELFYDESVQKIIKPMLHLYVPFVKFPRTKHLPWSAQRTPDDKTLTTVEQFIGKNIVVTVKLDGENTTLYQKGIHARSLDGYKAHPSRSRMKGLQASIGWTIPEHVRVCGENLYAKHTIHYHHLPEFFLVHSIWERNNCLDWTDTVLFSELLGLQTVPVLYRGIWNEKIVKECYMDTYKGDPMEGYVVRLEDGFTLSQFQMSTGKYVHNPITDEAHWMHKPVVPNELEHE